MNDCAGYDILSAFAMCSKGGIRSPGTDVVVGYLHFSQYPFWMDF